MAVLAATLKLNSVPIFYNDMNTFIIYAGDIKKTAVRNKEYIDQFGSLKKLYENGAYEFKSN